MSNNNCNFILLEKVHVGFKISRALSLWHKKTGSETVNTPQKTIVSFVQSRNKIHAIFIQPIKNAQRMVYKYFTAEVVGEAMISGAGF
jgi:hypothetical protein